MSKKDYQAIAAALYAVREPDAAVAACGVTGQAVRRQWEHDVEAVAAVLAAGNPRFDRARFLEACRTGKCKGMRPVAA